MPLKCAPQETLGANRQAAGGLLALGQFAGWIAHLIERRQQAFLIRPRGKFVDNRTECNGGLPRRLMIFRDRILASKPCCSSASG